MIQIKRSKKADSRTCDFKSASRQDLLESTMSHKCDVMNVMGMMSDRIDTIGLEHDNHKLENFERFYCAFIEGFRNEDWWNEHKKEHHHMSDPKDVDRKTVNLMHVIEYMSDCICAGIAREGSVTPVNIDPEVLMCAFKNTVDLIKNNIQVVE